MSRPPTDWSPDRREDGSPRETLSRKADLMVRIKPISPVLISAGLQRVKDWSGRRPVESLPLWPASPWVWAAAAGSRALTGNWRADINQTNSLYPDPLASASEKRSDREVHIGRVGPFRTIATLECSGRQAVATSQDSVV